ncbi:STE like transcription factor-domain-containing protein [Sporodiniella umbellata]|nr:STE like transcription factor-domain-containing protein [Sporodiniella umbellata]
MEDINQNSSAAYELPTDDNLLDRQSQMDEMVHFLSTAPHQWESQALKAFQLPNGENISCVLWDDLFYISGTDIVRSLIFRFHAFGRPVVNMKKFEEGLFSDLRNLKPGQDASLEEPRSELLDMLYKNNCIRTKKKQKVFYWFSVPHDRLFLDALERDLKRERMDLEPTTQSVAKPSTALTVNSTQELFHEMKKTLPHLKGPIPNSSLSLQVTPTSHSSTKRTRVQSVPAQHWHRITTARVKKTTDSPKPQKTRSLKELSTGIQASQSLDSKKPKAYFGKMNLNDPKRKNRVVTSPSAPIKSRVRSHEHCHHSVPQSTQFSRVASFGVPSPQPSPSRLAMAAYKAGLVSPPPVTAATVVEPNWHYAMGPQDLFEPAVHINACYICGEGLSTADKLAEHHRIMHFEENNTLLMSDTTMLESTLLDRQSWPLIDIKMQDSLFPLYPGFYPPAITSPTNSFHYCEDDRSSSTASSSPSNLFQSMTLFQPFKHIAQDPSLLDPSFYSMIDPFSLPMDFTYNI